MEAQHKARVMSETLDWYFDSIRNIDFQFAWVGVGIIHAVLSLITLLFLFTLATMIYRARPGSPENRFMSLMLFVEGLKTIVTWYAVYPFGPETLPYVQHWRVVYYTMCLLSILMYLSLSSFYPVRFLKFMSKDVIKKNLFWALPVLSVAIISVAIVSSGGVHETFAGSLHIECQEGSGEGDAIVTASYGENDYEGNCLEQYAPYDFITVEQTDLGRLLLMMPVITAFIALGFMRKVQKGFEKDEENEEARQRSSEARALVLGFGGKTFFQGSMLFFMIYITYEYGQFNSADLLEVEMNNRMKFYFYGLYGFLFSALFAGLFEGTMFTYAILKNEVLGIDEKLRKTFSTAIFATFGALLLVIASELVESRLGGSGWVGGVVVGAPLVVLRKPIYSIINNFSNRLMPEAFTSAESTYLEAFEIAREEGAVTDEARKFLNLQAKTLHLDEKRVEYLELWYDEKRMLEEE